MKNQKLVLDINKMDLTKYDLPILYNKIKDVLIIKEDTQWGIDEDLILYVDSTKEITQKQLAFTLAHEITHLILFHVFVESVKYPKEFRVATDMIVNDYLFDLKFCLEDLDFLPIVAHLRGIDEDISNFSLYELYMLILKKEEKEDLDGKSLQMNNKMWVFASLLRRLREGEEGK